MKSPLVSVIMPVYNCEAYVEDALMSVIKQTYSRLEIIIVDDSSTDKTWDVVKRIASTDQRIKPYKNQVNLKIVKTLNFAISKASGKYLARMDGDDIREPDSIRLQVQFLESNPDVVIVGGDAYICDKTMRVLNTREYSRTDKAIREKMFRYSPFTHATIMIRSELVPSNPYLLDWAEDYELYFKLGRSGKFANLPHVLYRIRTHEESVSQTKTRLQEKITLYIRLKAVVEYGYSMTLSDKAYFMGQLITMYLMPPRFRFWLFNKIRSRL